MTIGKDLELGSFANHQLGPAVLTPARVCQKLKKIESYPAPNDVVNIPLFTGFYIYIPDDAGVVPPAFRSKVRLSKWEAFASYSLAWT